MADLLPARVNVVLLGTGLPESIVAAACARVGQSVLHLDRRDYYGGNWASFNLRGLQDWIVDSTKGDSEEEAAEADDDGAGESWRAGDSEELVALAPDGGGSGVTGVEVFYYESEEAVAAEEQVPEEQQQDEGEKDANVGESEVEEKEEGVEAGSEVMVTGDQSEGSAGRAAAPLVHFSDVVKKGRHFNIDLAPNCLFARGALVELLIKSQVSRYAEFKPVTRILTLLHGRVQQVPCSRADVFSCRAISVVEKRLLMKLLELSVDCERRAGEYEAFRSKPFTSFLSSRGLTPDLRHFVVHSIAMTTEEVSTEAGLAATRRFLSSLGRYGNTPFLFPLYGTGELPQCFCRMSAVFAGTYCLRRSLTHLVVDKTSGRCVAVIDVRGWRTECDAVVMNREFLRVELRPRGDRRTMSRAILITDGSLLPGDSNQVSLLSMEAPAGARGTPWLLELPSATHTCADGTYLVHMTSEGRAGASARSHLEPIVSSLYRPATDSPPPGADAAWLQRPRVLMALYFTVLDAGIPDPDGSPDSSRNAGSPALPPNLFLCTGPGPGLDFDSAVKQAEDIFHKICPDDDFCPAAPNHEDLIFDDVESSAAPGSDTPATAGSDKPAAPGSDTPTAPGSDTPAMAGSDTPSTAGSDTPATAGSDTSATAGSDTPATAGSDMPTAAGSDVMTSEGGVRESFDDGTTVNSSETSAGGAGGCDGASGSDGGDCGGD